jgi:hypothetical protein
VGQTDECINMGKETGMAGALLRSGSLTEFCPLGAVGKPVYSAASQLLAAIRRRAGAETAAVFAIPKQNEQGDIIDWYAPVVGEVVPWSAASMEERSRAQNALKAARTKLAELSASLLNEDHDDRKSSELQVFGKLLAQATEIPGDDHIYLVQGRPAITFWGFHPLNAPAGHDVIGNLDAGGAAVNAPFVPAAGENVAAEPATLVEAEPRRGWLWWWWLPLLLLLLLLLLWIGLKMWGFELPFGPSLRLPVVVEEPEAPVAPEPVAPEEHLAVPDSGSVVHDSDSSSVEVREGDRWIVRDSDGVTVFGGSDGRPPATPAETAEDGGPVAGPGDATSTAEMDDPAGAADAAEGAEPATDPAATPEETGQPEAPATDESGVPEPPPMADPAATPGETGDETGQPGVAAATPAPEGSSAPLTIPAKSVQDGDTSFLDGGWRSSTGLQDTSGNPIQLGYTFKGGQGSVTMQRAVGDQKQSCTGSAKSAMESSRLVISQGAIKCPDGTTFNAPRVVCKVGAGGRADCEGVNEDGSTFPVSITR